MDEEASIPRPYGYTVGKLTDALRILATGKGDVRERVANAYLACIYLKASDDFPEELRSEWKWIEDQVTKYGAAEDTMRRRRRATAVKIAQRMWRLYWSMSDNTENE